MIHQTKRQMKTITLKGNEYELVIIDGSIVAQSMTEDLIFEEGADILADEAEGIYNTVDFTNMKLSEWKNEYTEDNIVGYCLDNIHKAVVINHNV